VKSGTLKVRSYFVCIVAATAVVALHAQQTALQVSGDVATPLSVTMADLKAMPRSPMRVTDEHGLTANYDGVLVGELLKRSGVPMGEALKGKALASYVVVTAKDGYRVVFTVAELDPAMTGSDVLLVDTMDGKPLTDAQGPLRLVVPHDKTGARWVRMIERLDVVRLK
jgi:DMSO/TMAO reductase YedYZ molybdopterin-dependent catalytic subunit